MSVDYWAACEATVQAVRHLRPQTADQVIEAITMHNPDPVSAGDAFWSPANAGDGLAPLLEAAGWTWDWFEAGYYWQMSRDHELFGRQTITYIEGDVLANRPIRPIS